MIIYENTVGQFIEEVRHNKIAQNIKNLMIDLGVYGGAHSEYMAWVNSLQFMRNVVDIPKIPSDATVAIEYQIPQTSKRVDFLIFGNDGVVDNIIIIELKQWTKASKHSDIMEHSIETYTGNGLRFVAHPSYQAYSYAYLIQNTSEIVQSSTIEIYPSAYLHNFLPVYKGELINDTFKKWIDKAPLFISNESDKLSEFISKYIKFKSSDNKLLYKIDKGRLKPSKALQDAIVSMMDGNDEFQLIDDQIIAYDYCIEQMELCQKDKKKRTIIIEGGPGTGKSVLALNLMKKFIEKGFMASYVTKNAAPRKAFLDLISKSDLDNKTKIKSLFRSPFGLSRVPANKYDALVIDEAHRLVKKMYRDYTGENQIKECIDASLLSIFLIDENQKITTKDIGTIEDIEFYGQKLKSEVHSGPNLKLVSQFRCNGSDAYIQFLDSLLQISEYVDTDLAELNYVIEVFDDPNEMRDELREINLSTKHYNKARMVAGYCYPWNIKNNRPYDYDILLDNGFKAKWNLPTDDKWAINPNSFEEVGCIHTAQGLEFDYIGVIIGKDLRYDKTLGKIITDQSEVHSDDKSSGIRNATQRDAEILIKNTYKTLLTRGQKGCFIYCEDKALSEFIKKRLGREN